MSLHLRVCLFFFVLSLFSFPLKAQNEIDALRYSFIEAPISIRSSGMGGAFGALGSDMSSFYHNPGGIGVYRRGGMEFTLGYHDTDAASKYVGSSVDNNRNNLTVQSLGIIWKRQLNNSDFGPLNIGVAYGKSNNFYQQFGIHGQDISSSMTDVFAAQANGTSYSSVYDSFPFGAGLAWDTYLIDPLDTTAYSYISAVNGDHVSQAKMIQRKGAMTETVFGLGSSYADVIFFGAGLGFQGVRFQEDNTYTETLGAGEVVDHFNYTEKLNVNGGGIYFNIGALVKATPWLRVGAAYRSRIVLGLTDVYSASMESFFKDNRKYSQQSPDNSFNYSVRSPSRLMGNIAFVMGDYGVITGDYEYVNFSSIKMKSTGFDNDYDFKEENNTIHTIYRGTHQLRVGVELRIAEKWRARAGARYQQSPFAEGATQSNTPYYSISLGGGYRRDVWSADIGLNYGWHTEDYYLYNPQLVDPASLVFRKLSILMGVGFRFD